MTTDDRQILDAFLREDLHTFVVRVFQTVNPGTPFTDNWHLQAINWQLTCCATGNNRRLLITQPPRSMKSLCVSVAYVAWMLGRDPGAKFICVSYSSELAAELARQFRAVVSSPWYRRVFPAMRAEKDTEMEFVTTLGGGRLATSVGGTLTGRGANTIIIDDPMKAEDALSENSRERAISWYRNTLVSRLNDKVNGVIIIVMQRLHEDDLAGHLLPTGSWQHLDLPAIATDNERIQIGEDEFHDRRAGVALQPDREPLHLLAQIKAEIGSLNFSAQYQQRPIPVEGNLIKWAWFKTYEYAPAHDSDGRIIQSWDTALKVGEKTDYSVCTTWLAKGSDYYLLDVFRERLEYPQLKRAIADRANRWAARSVLIEDKGSGTSLIQDFTYQRHGVRPIAIEPEKDKITRMNDQTDCLEAGQVHLPREAPWLDDFKNELLAFPASRNDDQVDSLSQFLKWIRDTQRRRVTWGRTIGMT